MAQKAIRSNPKLAEMIKKRRNELHLTIEEAAQRAGVVTKTWCRYEAGEAIRHDKYKGVCKALNWIQFPTEDNTEDAIDLEKYKNHEAWSKYLEKKFGEIAALSFVIGSDILLDHIKEDMEELSRLPKGTHIGQISTSFIESLLPKQFLMNYDYEFLYVMYCELKSLRVIAGNGREIIAHSVLDEIILCLIVEEAEFLIEEENLENDNNWGDWVYDIFDDMDVRTMLYSNWYVSEGNCYHFSHWLENQFY